MSTNDNRRFSMIFNPGLSSHEFFNFVVSARSHSQPQLTVIVMKYSSVSLPFFCLTVYSSSILFFPALHKTNKFFCAFPGQKATRTCASASTLSPAPIDCHCCEISQRFSAVFLPKSLEFLHFVLPCF